MLLYVNLTLYAWEKGLVIQLELVLSMWQQGFTSYQPGASATAVLVSEKLAQDPGPQLSDRHEAGI